MTKSEIKELADICGMLTMIVADIHISEVMHAIDRIQLVRDRLMKFVKFREKDREDTLARYNHFEKTGCSCFTPIDCDKQKTSKNE